MRSFKRFKMLKFWAQSFLGNIPRVIVGFRDDAGIIKSLQTYETLRIPSEALRENHWVSNLSSFLFFFTSRNPDFPPPF